MSGLELMRLVERWGGPVLVFGGRQGPLVPLISHTRMVGRGGCVFNLSPDRFYLLDVEGRYEAKQLCVTGDDSKAEPG